MQNYYFAGCRLSVVDFDAPFLWERLKSFAGETPFSTEITLSGSSIPFPGFPGAKSVFSGSGIEVRDNGGEGWFFSEAGSGRVIIKASRDCSLLFCHIQNTPACPEPGLEESFFHILRTACECRLARLGWVSLHSSCVSHNGQAVLFTAPSGTGKSTQAALWNKYIGAEVINGDRPFLSFDENGVLIAHGIPWDGKEQIFAQKSLPAAAIAEVRRSKTDRLRALGQKQAFALLMKQCFIPMWDEEAKFAVTSTVRAISKKAKVLRLFCLPEESAAELLCTALFGGKENLIEKELPDMKIKEGFTLRNIVDEWIVMPTGANIKKFEGAIVLNEVSASIWRQLEKPVSREDVLKTVLDEYDVDEATAAADLDELLDRLGGLDLLECECECE